MSETGRQSLLNTVVECAGLAPSIHNSQPWRISSDGDIVEISVDPARQLHWMDPDGRLARISCGAATEMARLAIRGLGLGCDVELGEGDTDLVAVIRVGGPSAIGEIDQQLLDGTAIRYTDRGPYDDRPIPPELFTEVDTVTAEYGAWLTAIEGHDDRRIVIQYLSDAEAAESSDPAYRAELESWLRERESADGIPPAALPAWPTTRVTDVPLRDFTGHASHPDPGAEIPPTVERDALVLILTNGDGPVDWACAGRTLAVLTLRAATMGITSQPLGPATDYSGVRRRLRKALGVVGVPQFLLRVGFGHGRPATRRLPVAQA